MRQTTSLAERPGSPHPAANPPLARAIVSAASASLVGIGLSRFAYTPLLPAIIADHWFTAAAAAYLGAANLAGYLAGALAGRALAARFPVAAVLRGLMALATLCFFASGLPLSFAWFFLWRFLAGFSGGGLMVLAAPAVLAHVPAARRGLLGGFIFMGVGLGVVASGSLVPLLLASGLRAAWFGLGGLSLALTLLAWGGWPGDGPHHASAARPAGPLLHAGRLRALYAEYALNAAGWVPHMLFLVDFVARGLGRGEAEGAAYWVIFGIGAMAGPVLAGMAGDRIGFRQALRAAFIIEILAILLPVWSAAGWALILSSLVVGCFVTGTVPLMLGRIHELLPGHPVLQRRAWSRATVGFALLQAAAAYGFSYVFTRTGGDDRLLFLLGALAMAVALVIDFATQRAGGERAGAPAARG